MNEQLQDTFSEIRREYFDKAAKLNDEGTVYGFMLIHNLYSDLDNVDLMKQEYIADKAGSFADLCEWAKTHEETINNYQKEYGFQGDIDNTLYGAFKDNAIKAFEDVSANQCVSEFLAYEALKEVLEEMDSNDIDFEYIKNDYLDDINGKNFDTPIFSLSEYKGIANDWVENKMVASLLEQLQ